jgi:hypothetical protein
MLIFLSPFTICGLIVGGESHPSVMSMHNRESSASDMSEEESCVDGEEETNSATTRFTLTLSSTPQLTFFFPHITVE